MQARLRALVASAAFLVPVGLMLPEVDWALDERFARQALVLSIPIAAAIVVHVPRVGLHAAARGLAWVYMAFGLALVLVPEVSGAAAILSTALGALVIIALGPASYAAHAERSGFSPVGMRRGFLAVATGASAVALVMGLSTVMLLGEGDVIGAALLGTMVLGLVTSTTLVLRMRALGVLIALGTFVLGATLSLLGPTASNGLSMSPLVWPPTLAAGAFLLPILWSRVRPVTPGAPSGRVPWTELIAITLVGITVVDYLRG